MLNKIKLDIDKALKNIINSSNKTYGIKSINSDLYDGLEDFLLRDGKRIRPALFCVAYRGYEKKKKLSDKDLAEGAAVLEMLHDFFLIHDDIIDNADTRRGGPSLHKLLEKKSKVPSKTAESLAIVAGDLLLISSIQTFMNVPINEKLKKMSLEKILEAAYYTGLGEYLDIINEGRSLDEIKPKDIMKVYELKTARYTFEAPLTAGALLAGAKKEEILKLSKCGMLLGKSFQIADDIIDILRTTEESGKPHLSDLKESKKTLIVLKAVALLSKKDAVEFNRIFAKKSKSNNDLQKLKEYLISTGAIKSSVQEAKRMLSQANKIIQSLSIKKQAIQLINRISEKLECSLDIKNTNLGK
ncbi:MAG: polyprenyl synthetase family protein [Candidatus Omnitrophica bacterium]|nr:polyprenyl synthetase family protein [Candidatus Omnitrophota bacterium]